MSNVALNEIPLQKSRIVSEFAERFGRPDDHQRHVQRILQQNNLMARAAGRGQRPPRENQTGLTAYAIATLHDAPHADLAQLTLETMEAPVQQPVLFRRNASGGWVGDRSHDEIMKEGAGSADASFSETFAGMLGFGSPSGLRYLGDAFDLAILAASRGRFEANSDLKIDLDFYLLWRRPAGFLRLCSRKRKSPAQELWAHFGDTEHRPGQGAVRITTDDFRFFGDLLRRGA